MPSNTSSLNASRVPTSPEILMEKIRRFSADTFSNDINFHNESIADVTLENQRLRGAEFHFASFSGVRFCGVDLGHTEFQFAEFHNVEFFHCSMGNCKFQSSKFDNVTFTKCLLDGSEFDFISGKAVFRNCQMRHTEFPSAEAELELHHCNGVRAEFNCCPALKIHAQNCNFRSGEFNDSKLLGTFSSCFLPQAEFNSCCADEMTFKDCHMHSIETKGSTGIIQTASLDSADDDLFANVDDDDDLSF